MSVLTNNHLQVLQILSNREEISVDRIVRQVTFTRHELRIMRILFDLREKHSAIWLPNGNWAITQNGKQMVDAQAAT